MTVSTVRYEPIGKTLTLHIMDSLEQETLSIESLQLKGNRVVLFEEYCGTQNDQGMIRRDSLGSLSVQVLGLVTLFRLATSDFEEREEFNCLQDPLDWLYELDEQREVKVLQGDWISGFQALRTTLGQDYYQWVEENTREWVIFPSQDHRPRGSIDAICWETKSLSTR